MRHAEEVALEPDVVVRPHAETLLDGQELEGRFRKRLGERSIQLLEALIAGLGIVLHRAIVEEQNQFPDFILSRLYRAQGHMAYGAEDEAAQVPDRIFNQGLVLGFSHTRR